MDLRFAAAVTPVSAVDRAKALYEKAGWRLDAGAAGGVSFRIVQFTPPGSECSVRLGTNMTSAVPGSARGLYLVVSDIDEVRDRLVVRGVEVSEVFREGTPGDRFQAAGASGRVSGPAPKHGSYPRSPRSPTRTATAGCCGRSQHGCPAGSKPLRRHSRQRRTWRGAMRRAGAAHGEHEKRIGAADPDWPDWYAGYMVAEQDGSAPPT